MSAVPEMCGAASMSGRGYYTDRHGDAYHAGGAHICGLLKGHKGPHRKIAVERIGETAGIRYSYHWLDKSTLTCAVEVVEIEADQMTIKEKE